MLGYVHNIFKQHFMQSKAKLINMGQFSWDDPALFWVGSRKLDQNWQPSVIGYSQSQKRLLIDWFITHFFKTYFKCFIDECICYKSENPNLNHIPVCQTVGSNYQASNLVLVDASISFFGANNDFVLRSHDHLRILKTTL